MNPAYVYRAACVRVVDGDTFVAELDLGLRVSITVPIRLHGVNTPERGQPGWTEATDFLEGLLLDVPLVLQTYKDRRSFERWVADVWTPDGSVAEQIVNAGMGVAVA